LIQKMGFAWCTFARMLKDLARALHDWHDGQIPVNYKNLLNLPGIDDRAAMLYLNYSEERSEVSLLLVYEKFSPEADTGQPFHHVTEFASGPPHYDLGPGVWMDPSKLGWLCWCPGLFVFLLLYDEVHTTLGSLGQIIWDHQLPFNDIILAASYVCLDLIWLIWHVYRVHHNLQGHPDIDDVL